MYQKIMVPLDGSKLAECVLPHLEAISKGCNVRNVVLVRIVEPVHLPVGIASDGGGIYTDENAEQVRKESDSYDKTEAEEYLN